MKKILIFASGNGSNAENIIQYFQKNRPNDTLAVLTNNSNAKVIEKAKNLQKEVTIFTKADLNSAHFIEKIQIEKPDLIVLAGFLLQFPEKIIQLFPHKIINLHPALLPKYGGKGMYGMHVHEAVLANQEAETGITIHYVNENYDEGEIIFQAGVTIAHCKTAEVIAAEIHILEQQYFPEIIEDVLKNGYTKTSVVT